MTRAQTAENLGGISRRIWTVGTVFLMIAAAFVLASCGGEEASGADTGGEVAFTDFDADDSGYLDEGEFNDGIYNDADADNSGTIEEAEYNSSVDTWYGDDYDGDFAQWDADGDGELAEEEFGESVADAGLYTEWDADNNDEIVEDEFNERV